MCEHVKVAKDHHLIVCGLRTFKKFCQCGREAVALCDWKVTARKTGTCDRPVCSSHAKAVAGGRKHLCPEHQVRYDEWKRRHPSPQGELFPEAA